jgi:pimeloyl-ACP methyl ester carboxylesterase
MSNHQNFAKLNGVSLAYRDIGSGLPIVFIHGHAFNQSMWDPQISALSSRYRVITFDLRGYGASEVPAVEATSLETMAADVNALLDHLGIAKAVVAGLSMGGQIAMAFAELYPQRLIALVLAATFSEIDSPEVAAARRTTADRFINEGSAIPGGEMLTKLLAHRSIKRDPALAVAVYTMIALTPPAGAAAALRGRSLRKDYTPGLKDIAVPTIVFGGTEDAYTSVETITRMQQAIPNSQLRIFDGIGHMPNLEAPSLFNAALDDFLKTLE